jgi:hypothetical protein
VASYQLMVDGEPAWHAKSEADLRGWLAEYCEKHRDDDPGAAHVQIRRLGRLAWLTGGSMVDRRQFL